MLKLLAREIGRQGILDAALVNQLVAAVNVFFLHGA